jgi:hypothetical protein
MKKYQIYFSENASYKNANNKISGIAFPKNINGVLTDIGYLLFNDKTLVFYFCLILSVKLYDYQYQLKKREIDKQNRIVYILRSKTWHICFQFSHDVTLRKS